MGMPEDVPKNKSITLDILVDNPIIWMHDVANVPGMDRIANSKDIAGVHDYDRWIPLARKNDVVFVRNKPDSDFIKYLLDNGLGTENIIAVGNEHKSIPHVVIHRKAEIKRKVRDIMGADDFNRAVVSTYFPSTAERKASFGKLLYANIGMSERYNQKLNFRALAERSGISVVPGKHIYPRTINDLLKFVERQFGETGSAFLTYNIGASGSGSYPLTEFNADEIAKIFKENERDAQGYVLSPFMDYKSNPSTNWFITEDGKIYHLRTSNQILSGGKTHQGNYFPFDDRKDDVEEQSYRLIKTLADSGFVGPAGIDWNLTETEMHAGEINPRFTGAMYPFELVSIMEKRHPDTIGSAKSKNIILQGIHDFEDLQYAWHDLLYDAGTFSRGDAKLIPFNMGPLQSSQKITAVGIGPDYHTVQELFREAEHRVH